MIGIDGNEANVDQRVGSNVYAYQVLKGLHQIDTRSSYQIYLKQSSVRDLPNETKNWRYRLLGNYPLWTQWRLPLDLYTAPDKPSVFFTPGHYAPRWSPAATIISILDLSFLYFPEAFQPKVLNQLTHWTKRSALHAKHILTISEHSKADIVRAYNIDPDKITVTYLGADIAKPDNWNQTEQQKIMKKYGIHTKYFLFIGTRQPKKNLDSLIKAFKKIQARERNISLVIVGKTWHQFSQAEIDGGHNIIFTGFAADADIPKLLLGAEAFVFPSLYEGFGIPVLEAMSLGTLVTASNTSSIPEIIGDSPLLFNPKKIDEIENQLISVLEMKPDLKKKLIREGKIRSKQFSWDKCAKQTLEVLKRYGS